MPVKWTPEKDQMLLLKILETHEFKVDTNRVSTTWPGNLGDRPTPRAIQERLARIRADARKSGAMPAATAVKASVSTARAPATPRKNAAKSAPVTPAARANGFSEGRAMPATDLKRKRDFVVKAEPVDLVNGFADDGGYGDARQHVQSIEAVDLTDGVAVAAASTPSKPLGTLSLNGGAGLQKDEAEEEDESPTKRARAQRSTSRAVVSYAESDHGGCGSDGSDYQLEAYEEDFV